MEKQQMQPLEEILALSNLILLMWPAISVSWNKASVSVKSKIRVRPSLFLWQVVTEMKKPCLIVDDQKKSEEGRSYFGNADADNQEITSGVTDGAKVISNPTSSLEEGKEVKDDEKKKKKYLQELSKWWARTTGPKKILT